jgi:hypothetical protein
MKRLLVAFVGLVVVGCGNTLPMDHVRLLPHPAEGLPKGYPQAEGKPRAFVGLKEVVPYNVAMLSAAEARKHSEAEVLRLGGKVNSNLPLLDRSWIRTNRELVQRALILNAMINIARGAPIKVIRDWIEGNGLSQALAPSERRLLTKRNADLTQQEINDLGWRTEALWSLMWAGGLADRLPLNEHIPDYAASLCPDLHRNEDGSKFIRRMRMRPADELFQMADLYYVGNWYARDGRVNGYSTGAIEESVMVERRQALGWLMDAGCDWDAVDLST